MSCLIHSRRAIQEGHQWQLRCRTPTQEHSPVRAAWQEGGMEMSHARRPGRRLGPSQSAIANKLLFFFGQLMRDFTVVQTPEMFIRSADTIGNIRKYSRSESICKTSELSQRKLSSKDTLPFKTFRDERTNHFQVSGRCSCILVSCSNTIGNFRKSSQTELFCTSKLTHK